VTKVFAIYDFPIIIPMPSRP